MTLPDHKTAKIAGRTVSWREKGTGTALVLIHGTGGSSASWEAQFDRYPDRYRVIAWDAPGYGGSDPWGDTPPTADDYAGLLGSFLDSRGVATAHVVGHSIGAVLAASLCRKKPTTVLSLVLLHPIPGFGALTDAERAAQRETRLKGVDTVGMAAFVEAWAPTVLGSAAGADQHARALEIMRDLTEGAYRDMVEVISSGDLFANLPKIRVPSLVVAGRDDGIATEDGCRAIADALTDAEFLALDGIGHYLPLENPPLFQRTFDAFLADKTDIGTYF